MMNSNNSNNKSNIKLNSNKQNNFNKDLLKESIKNNKTERSNLVYYYSVMIGLFLWVFSYIPLAANVIKNRRTNNLPYITYFLSLIASMIFILICVSKRYYIHFILFLILLLCNIVILYYKTKYNNEYFTPSPCPDQSYFEFANTMRERGQCSMVPRYENMMPKLEKPCKPIFTQ